MRLSIPNGRWIPPTVLCKDEDRATKFEAPVTSVEENGTTPITKEPGVLR